jgi:hypothetical protein
MQGVSERAFQWYSKCHHLERWMVCTHLSANVFVTLATQLHLEYHCKAPFETSCIDHHCTVCGNALMFPARSSEDSPVTEDVHGSSLFSLLGRMRILTDHDLSSIYVYKASFEFHPVSCDVSRHKKT